MGKWPYFAEFLQLGWVVAFSLLIPLGIGLWLDKRLGTTPLFIIVGMVVGILAATVGTVRIAFRMMDKLSQERKSQRDVRQDNS
ncbi:MAG: AtpZ/AtpI family protein [Anaerolineae bacterium]